MANSTFRPWLERWKLLPDGAPLITHTSQLLPVITVDGNQKAMLKITADPHEQTGNALMVWWEGNGAARVIAHDNEAILLERATGAGSLSALSRSGEDETACRILCQTACYLHASQKSALPQLISLQEWFGALKPAAKEHDGFLVRSLVIAQELLSSEQDIVVLHGDLHHENVLDFGDCDWRAIDPKGLIGERGFEYANIFTNPDLSNPVPQVACVPEIFYQRLESVSRLASLDKTRLLMWIVAWCGLSTAWSLEDNKAQPVTFEVAKLALAELDR
jgi:Streptomycin 6-kinase